MDIEDARYAELVAAEQEAKALKERLPDLEATAAKVPDLEQTIVDKEAEAAREKQRADAAESKLSDAEAKEQAEALKSERFEKLGNGFKSKLDGLEFTKKKLESVASTASPEEWDTELKVVEESLGVKRDEGGTAKPEGDDTFDAEAVASSRVGGGNGNGNSGGKAPSREAVGSVVRGLISKK